ncbi:MAG: type II toxin-antitoxin system RelB/DinJ family antitoxin [Acidaminococcaceae bacterium]|nr:type II toxin-antitoxin system RelB/DinJ family antitoxin [Acidaminococcaceae bacterium]
MAEQVLIQFRADKALKQEVTEIYESIGLDMPTAFRMFMVRSKMVGGLPFDARLPIKKPVAAASMTKEELDSEIQKGYDDMLTGNERPAEEVFNEFRKKYKL